MKRLQQGELVEIALASDDTDRGFRIPEANIEVAIPPSGMGEARGRFVVTGRDSSYSNIRVPAAPATVDTRHHRGEAGQEENK